MDVRVKYLHRPLLAPEEEARHVVSGVVTLAMAKKIVASGYYREATIVLNEDGYPRWLEK